MKKMLVRSGQAPWDIVDPVEMMKRDTIGRNVGNFVYAYSVFRNLYSEDVDLVSDNYSTDVKKADYINENYDAYVLPLANGFRQSFIPTLRRYTALIKKLKIPVYVIGIGVQAPYEIDVKNGFSFDNDVKEFVSTVLDHSSMLGLRGQITSDYLSALGFKEGRDHTVIGCPSMYTFGDNINIRSLTLTSESKINTSLTPSASQNVVSFIHSLFDNYENACYIPQDTEELVMAYSGAPMYGGTAFQAKTFDYPSSINSKEYKEDRMKFFLSAKTWFDHVKQSDFNIGTRLHGNIVSTINGTPSISIPIDARMRELTEYHNLTRILPNEIKADDKLEDLIDRVDFRSAEKVHHRNFENFVSFLDENKIIHTYRENTPGVPKHLDKRLENTDLLPPVTSITGVTSVSEIQKRISHGFDDLRDKQVTILNRQNAREKKLKEEKAKLKKQNIQLNKKVTAPAIDKVNLDVKTIVNLSEDIKIKNEALSKKDEEIKVLKSKLSDIKSILD